MPRSSRALVRLAPLLFLLPVLPSLSACDDPTSTFDDWSVRRVTTQLTAWMPPDYEPEVPVLDTPASSTYVSADGAVSVEFPDVDTTEIRASMGPAGPGVDRVILVQTRAFVEARVSTTTDRFGVPLPGGSTRTAELWSSPSDGSPYCLVATSEHPLGEAATVDVILRSVRFTGTEGLDGASE